MRCLGLCRRLVVGILDLLKDAAGLLVISGAGASQTYLAGCAVKQGDAEMGLKLHHMLGRCRS